MHRVLSFFTREFHCLVGEYITTDDVITFFFSWIKCIFTHVASIYANLLEQKKAIYMRKELNSQRIVLVHQHGRGFTVLEHQNGRRDVMWKRSIETNDLPGLIPEPKVRVWGLWIIPWKQSTPGIREPELEQFVRQWKRQQIEVA